MIRVYPRGSTKDPSTHATLCSGENVVHVCRPVHYQQPYVAITHLKYPQWSWETKFLLLINFNIGSHMVTVLDSAALDKENGRQK